MSRRSRGGKFQSKAYTEKNKIRKEGCTDERNDNANAEEKAEAERQAKAQEEIEMNGFELMLLLGCFWRWAVLTPVVARVWPRGEVTSRQGRGIDTRP